MKICWDTLEKVRYTCHGNFRIGRRTYYEHDSCFECGEPFLGGKDNKCCDPVCKGKTTSPEARKKMSISAKARVRPRKTKKKASISKGRGKTYPERMGENNPRWDGGYRSNNIPKYDLYAPQLEPYEECRRNEKDPNILEVKCILCGTWFVPLSKAVEHRIGGFFNSGGNHFYCSPKCKELCPIFNKHTKTLMKLDAIKAGRTSLKKLRNEVPKWIRDKVLELDDHTCQMCGSKDKLHVHHEVPQKKNQMLALDVDNCVSVCIPCHKWVHTQIDGCRYHELADLELC